MAETESENIPVLETTILDSETAEIPSHPNVHETYVDGLASLQPVRCNDKACGCGNFHCPLCDSGTFQPVPTISQAKEHVSLHWKNRVDHKGKYIVQCLMSCDKGSAHFHCPKCGQTVYKRNSFSAHLECHRPTEIYNTVAAVVNPSLFQHMPGDIGMTLMNIQQTCDVTCNLSKDTWCVVQGKWENVNRARRMFEDVIVMPVTMEIEDSPDAEDTAEYLNTVNEGGDNNGELTTATLLPSTGPRKRGRPRKVQPVVPASTTEEVYTPETDIQNSTPDGSTNQENTGGARRSGRRRVLNSRFAEYAVPKKLRKIGPGTTTDYDELESLSEDEEDDLRDEDYVQIVTMHGENTSGSESSKLTEPSSIPSGMDLNIEQDDTGGTTVSLTLKEETPPSVPMRKVIVSHGAKYRKKCSSCGKVFNSAKKLANHLNLGQCYRPESAEDLKCVKCDYEAHRTFDLKLHYERHHQEKTWECPVCHKKFGPLYDLKMHYKYTGHNGGLKTERAKCQCPICHKEIQQKGLQNHIRTVHENIRPHACETCGKAFWTKHLLKTHLESHKSMAERVRPYVCEICNQGFFAKMALEDHRTKHTGSPKYSCDQCGKQFYYYTGWQRHLVSHSDDRPHTCDICKKTFKTNSNLYAHKQSHGQPTFVCRCGKAYQHKHNLVSHCRRCPNAVNHEIGETVEIDTLANQRYICGYCTASFTEFPAVQEHLAQHVAAGETDNVHMEATELDASMLEQLAVAAVEAGSDNLDTLQQLAMTAMQHSQQANQEQAILVDQSETGSASAMLEGQQVLQGNSDEELVNILVTGESGDSIVGEVQQVLEVGNIDGVN